MCILYYAVLQKQAPKLIYLCSAKYPCKYMLLGEYFHHITKKSRVICCTAIILLTTILLITLPAGSYAKYTRADILPLLEYDDAVRSLERRNNPKLLIKLRNESPSKWVKVQAARKLSEYYAQKNQWDLYKAVAGHASHCALLLNAINDGHQLAIRKAVNDALAEDPANKSCINALDKASAAGFLLDDQVWRQIRILIDNKEARKARLLLTLLKEDKASYNQLNNAIQNATRRIKGKHPLSTRVERELLAVSAIVSARRNALLVGERWELFAPHIDQDINNQVWPIIGKWVSLSLKSTESLKYFNKVSIFDHQRFALAWRARAAMRVSDWRDVKNTIKHMQGEQATLSAWKFWLALANHRIGNQTLANQQLKEIASNFDDYYGLLAKELTRSKVVIGKGLIHTNYITNLENDADVRLAIALGLQNRTTQARTVWKYLIRGLSDREILALSKIAQDAGWFLGSINAADAANFNNSNHNLRYPLPYHNVINQYALRNDLNAAFVYAIIRQESRFNTKAVSSAGARGIMQVMPRTAQIVANKHKYTRYNKSRLSLLEPNVTIGTRYLADLRNQVGTDYILLSAMYNAGPSNVKKWLRASRGIDKMVFIETIPFTETRLYVKHVLANFIHYDLLLNRNNVKLVNLVAGKYN